MITAPLAYPLAYPLGSASDQNVKIPREFLLIDKIKNSRLAQAIPR
jgi:hypothetical protein